VVVKVHDALMTSDRPASIGCFPVGPDSFLIETPVGRGTVVSLGGFSPFTDQLLRSGDNAALALRVFAGDAAPGTAIVFGPPVPPGAASKGFWGTVPAAARVVIFELAFAGLYFMIVRGRRHGAPVLEQ